jgi:hypothetical protein
MTGRGLALLPLVGALTLAACPDRGTLPESREDRGPVYQAAIRGLGEIPVTGSVRLEVGEDAIRAAVAFTGLEPGEAVAQHVYAWWDCTTIARIVINLDTLLTIPGEGPPRGEAYPRADAEGRLEFTATRPLADFAGALRQYRGMLVEELDLGNRTVFLRDEGHRPIACGELRRVE